MTQRTVLRIGGAVLLALATLLGSAGPADAAASWWQPKRSLSLTWQIQLSRALDTSVGAMVYDVDAFDTTAAQVDALHARHRKVVCQVSVGTYEDWRTDRARFPAAVLGAPVAGWSGHRWLDIRRWDLLQPVMTARLRSCRAKGFDAVDPVDVDGYTAASGFPLTAAHQLAYNRRIAALAHGLGLGVGLHGDPAQAAALAPSFDFAIDEECVRLRRCDLLTPFTAAGKPVLHIEYAAATGEFCPVTKPLGFTSIRKRTHLDAWRQAC